MNELEMIRLGECRVPDLIYSRLFLPLTWKPRYLVHVAMLHVRTLFQSTHICDAPDGLYDT